MNNNEPSPADSGEGRVEIGKVPDFRKEDIFFCTYIGYGQRYNRHYSGIIIQEPLSEEDSGMSNTITKESGKIDR